ncbi:MAG: hypothetical protein UHH87_05260 [Akkermansia sp.]|nr:hypothetical protein [Akkermansia sp.]MEE1265677.1 hypothetical protein [Akkermansia sp.]
MKFTALILSVVSAVALSSCCCQKQAMPKLRNMPMDLVPEDQIGTSVTPGVTAPQPTAPVKVLDGAGK